MKFLIRVLFWKYGRGTWQYDILCGLILAFIFLTPRTVFDARSHLEVRPQPRAQENLDSLPAGQTQEEGRREH